MTLWQASVSSPVNIACIKYWGKRDTKLILPTNDTLSVSLDQNQFCTVTTARADPSFTDDKLWLNGKEERIEPGGRVDTCIKAIRALREQYEHENSKEEKASIWHLHIASRNNFPTAAGLASSAAGFSALVYSLARTLRLPNSNTELSIIARQGSGSSCRSLFGGFVAWKMGSDPNGSDSIAVQIASEDHWPDMHALICVVSDQKKATSSTTGMQRTVETSTLLQHRIKHVVPQRMKAITEAILQKDFDSFARITMQDSNQFHAVCLDTDPPVFYLNEMSKLVIALVNEYNRISVADGKRRRAAYTFDAGPNPVIYILEENMKDIINVVLSFCELAKPFEDTFSVFDSSTAPSPAHQSLPVGFNADVVKPYQNSGLKGLIHTKIGGGPKELSAETSLLDESGMLTV